MLVLQRVGELVGEHQLKLPAGLCRALDQDDLLVPVVVGRADLLRGAARRDVGGRLLGKDPRQPAEAGTRSLELAGALQAGGLFAHPPDQLSVQALTQRRELGGAHHPDARRALEAKSANPLPPAPPPSPHAEPPLDSSASQAA